MPTNIKTISNSFCLSYTSYLNANNSFTGKLNDKFVMQ